MSTLLLELRLALRSLVRERAFTAVIVATLALSIGATTAVFSVVYQVLWRPLPYPEASQLYRLMQTTTPGAGAGPHKDRTRVNLPVWTAWRGGATAFSRIEGLRARNQVLSSPDFDAQLMVGRASAGLLPMLGVQPVLGRLWGPELEVAGRDRELVLAYGLWQRAYGGSPAVLGRSVLLDGQPHTVVGVLPEDFRYEPDVEAWKPLVLDPASEQHATMRVVGRLRPGVSPAQATEQLTRLAFGAERLPDDVLTGVALEPLHGMWVEGSRTQLQVVLGVAALLLLLGCANLTNLLLARGSARSHELAVRMALGASRAQLVRLLLVESLVRALLGGAAGLLVAVWGRDLLEALVPPQLTAGAGVEPYVLAIALGVSVATAVLVGLVPALYASRGGGRAALAPVVRGARAASAGIARAVLVVVQLSLALVPLVGAGLMLRTVWALQHTPLGFEPHGVTVAEVYLPQDAFADEAARAAAVERLTARLEALPGVSAAGLVGNLPLTGSTWRPTVPVRVVGEDAPPGATERAGYTPATGGYFRALGIPLKEGRYPAATDTPDSPPVVVVTEAFARHHFPDRSALGARLVLGAESEPHVSWEVVGVVADVPMERLSLVPTGDVYVPASQDMGLTMSLAVKSALPPAQLAPLLLREVRAADPHLRMVKVRPLDTLVQDSSAQVRTVSGLLGAFAVLGVVLAGVGLYGLLAFWVAQRTRELAIRSALGASPERLLRMVVAQGLRLTGAGLVAGLLGAGLMARALASLLYGVSAFDPLVFAGGPVVLLGIAMLASWGPAAAAVRVSPNEALKR